VNSSGCRHLFNAANARTRRAVNSTTPEDLATAAAIGAPSTSDAALTASVSAAIDLTKCARPASAGQGLATLQ